MRWRNATADVSNTLSRRCHANKHLPQQRGRQRSAYALCWTDAFNRSGFFTFLPFWRFKFLPTFHMLFFEPSATRKHLKAFLAIFGVDPFIFTWLTNWTKHFITHWNFMVAFLLGKYQIMTYSFHAFIGGEHFTIVKLMTLNICILCNTFAPANGWNVRPMCF